MDRAATLPAPAVSWGTNQMFLGPVVGSLGVYVGAQYNVGVAYETGAGVATANTLTVFGQLPDNATNQAVRRFMLTITIFVFLLTLWLAMPRGIISLASGRRSMTSLRQK